MDIFKAMALSGHEQLIFNYDRASGLKALIAIHDTTLGPAIGGLRMFPYASEGAAVEDVLRLSQGMTYKAAAAGIDFGGGNAVILGDPGSAKSEPLFRAFGRFLNTLQGRCIIGEDVGTNEFDLVQMAKETKYVLGLPKAYGGSGETGDMTALGVVTAMRAGLTQLYGSPSLQGRSVAIQGLGKVGYHLAQRCALEGAHVIAADMNPHLVGKVAAELSIEAADPWAILDTACDVLAPCAMGRVISADIAAKLSCKIVAGSANNQLESPEVAQILQERGILYAPDFIVNAGGLIQVANESGGYDEDRVRHQVENIFDLLLSVFQRSEEQQQSTVAIAMEIVRERMDTLESIHRIYSQHPSAPEA